jgi:hypothetical protein
MEIIYQSQCQSRDSISTTNRTTTFIGPVGTLWNGQEIWVTYDEVYANEYARLVQRSRIKNDYLIYFQGDGDFVMPINGMYLYVMK